MDLWWLLFSGVTVLFVAVSTESDMSPIIHEGRIRPDVARLEGICRKYHVRRLSLFGSVLRDDFKSDSDVDFLVDFHPGRTPGFAFFSLQHELSELIGRTVDLHTAEDLPVDFRAEVSRAAVVQFEAEPA